MAKKHESVTITVSVDENVKILMEEYAQEIGQNLSMFSRNLIYSTIDDLRILKGARLINLDMFKAYSSPESMALSKFETNSASKEVNISVIIREDVKSDLVKIADSLGLTLKQVARNLIYVGIYEHQQFKKVGLIKIFNIARGFIGAIKGAFGSEKSE